jgi:hypothetical protein
MNDAMADEHLRLVGNRDRLLKSGPEERQPKPELKGEEQQDRSA